MSISIATGGLFNPCCGSRIAGGGGAPPYRQNYDDRVRPTILIRNVEMKTKNSINYLEQIKVKLVDSN